MRAPAVFLMTIIIVALAGMLAQDQRRIVLMGNVWMLTCVEMVDVQVLVALMQLK